MTEYMTRTEANMIEDAKRNISYTDKFPTMILLEEIRPSATDVGKSPGYNAGIIHLDSRESWIFMGLFHKYLSRYVLAPGGGLGVSKEKYMKIFGSNMVEKKCYFCNTVTYLPIEIGDLDRICWDSKNEMGLSGRSDITIMDYNLDFSVKISSQVDMTNSNEIRMTGVGPLMKYYNVSPRDSMRCYGLVNPGGHLDGALLVEILK